MNREKSPNETGSRMKDEAEEPGSFLRKAWHKIPKGVRRILWISATVLVVPPILLLAALEGIRWYQLTRSAQEYGGIVHTVIRHPVAVPAAWAEPEPFAPETLAAYSEFVRCAKAADDGQLGPPEGCWSARRPLEKSAVVSGMTEEALDSMAPCVAGYEKALAAFKRLVLSGDFSADIFLGLPYFRDPYYQAYNFCCGVYPLHLWTLARADAEAAVFEALEVHRAALGALPRTANQWAVCWKTADLSVLTAAGIVRWTGDPELAALALQFLDQTPPEAQGPESDSPEWQVYCWLVGWEMGPLREAKRVGYPADLTRPRSVIETLEFLNNVDADYLRWVARSPLPRAGTLSGRLYTANEADPAGATGFLGFLSTHDLGPWSDAAKELHIVRSMSWSFGHTFPLGKWTAVSHLAPKEWRRMAVDLARLNLAAVLYRAETGGWPGQVSDVVPRYVKLERGVDAAGTLRSGDGTAGPGDAAAFDPGQLYVWSANLEVFVARDGYNPFVMAGIL